MSNQFIAQDEQNCQTALTVHYGAFNNPECPCIFLYPVNKSVNEPDDIIQQIKQQIEIKQGQRLQHVRR